MSTLINDASNRPVQLFHQSGVRVTLTTTDASTTAGTALPTNLPSAGALVEIRATDVVYINFGSSSGVVAALDSTSLLFPAGEKVMELPSGSTHFAIIRATANNATVQIEKLN